MRYRWVLRPMDTPDVVERLRVELNQIHTALARTLVLRGIQSFEEARQFFRPALSHLHDPFLMQDMAAAADRVTRAIRGRERVVVYGDYDVDGTTATALMTSFLRERGASVRYYIPHRIEDGYGLGHAGIQFAADADASLIIALDCGITAVNEADAIRTRGIDLIICDHHKPDATLPDACAVLNPKRPDCDYPFKELSGCGVGFKLVQAVMQQLGEDPEAALAYLDLVALSTASDIVPIVGENRILMSEGLKTLQTSLRPGLRKLAERARLDLAECSMSRIVFGLGPRINAAGRMGDACRAVELMLEQDDERATELAAQLEVANDQRRTFDHDTLIEACHLADLQIADGMKHSLVLFRPGWHLGVVGIVASRLVERFYRPTIMLSSANGGVKGSARSVSGVNIYDALRTCEDLLSTFGGHDFAAGLSLPLENVEAFRRRFDEVVGAMNGGEELLPVLEIDAPLLLSEIDSRFWSVLRQFAPHGPENDIPIFQTGGLQLARPPRLMGREGEHVRFVVRQHGPDGSSAEREVVGFRMNHQFPTLQKCQYEGKPLELLFSIEENTWKGTTSLQLRARDLRLEDG
jgi:single-stranded-DNA-specific exonuclease